MSHDRILVEGGGDSKELHARCRERFRKLLEKSGFEKRIPRIVACGSRMDTYDTFKTMHSKARDAFIVMLIDSEDPVKDVEKPWDHLRQRPGDLWKRPMGATDSQVILMTTCMETWIIFDRVTLRKHYLGRLQESTLPSTMNIETKHRHEMQDVLMHATRNCSNRYAKGKRSFDVLGEIDPETLKQLPSFARMIRILERNL